MAREHVDQIFVTAKHWLLSLLPDAPDWVVSIASSLLNIAAVLGAFMTLFALISVLERKILARIQNRYGPNRVGPFGLLQPLADGIKLLIKEDVVPLRADKIIHFIAPIMIAATAILAFGVIPYGRNMTPFSIDGGILFFFAVGSATELGVFMAGWGSNNKFSMLGAMRAIAQMVSYELPLIITVLPVIMIVGSLSADAIVAAQEGYVLVGIVPRWFVFTPWGAAAFILFFVSGLVESNRTPFDVPEGESEIVAGHMTEYSGFKYANFFLAEYFGMFAISGLAVTLFLGGWHSPISVLQFIPSYRLVLRQTRRCSSSSSSGFAGHCRACGWITSWVSPGNSCCRWRSPASSPRLSGIIKGTAWPDGFGRWGWSRLFTSACRDWLIRKGNWPRAPIASPNEHRRFLRHCHFDPGRRARRRVAAEAYSRGPLSRHRVYRLRGLFLSSRR